MWQKEFSLTYGSGFLLLALFLAPVGTTASVQSPECRGVIEGLVSDSDGQPARGINVVAWPLGINLGVLLPNTRTDETGKYRFANLCPFRFTVLVDDDKNGYRITSPEVFEFLYGRRVAKTKLSGKHISARLNVQLPPKPGTIRIHSTNHTNNDEVQEFAVRLVVPNQRHMPWVEFRFSRETANRNVEVPPDKDFILWITADGFDKFRQNFDGREMVHVRAGEQVTLDAQLQPLNDLPIRRSRPD
jgi:hypothetical protein